MELAHEFQLELERREQIRTSNWVNIMTKLISFIRDDYFMKNGILLTDKECMPYAQDMFAEAKKQGKYDDLNFKVEEMEK